MTLLIFASVMFFAIRYRRKRADEPNPKAVHGSIPLEIFWAAVPLLVMLVMFGWGAELFYEAYTPPKDAMQLYVTGKQWMWKVQYPEGQREINELHVPVGRDIEVTLASEDVIHSFFIPAFRVKHDVVPGTFQHVWFHPTKVGRYHLFCAEYCGTDHSGMVGWVDVMTPMDYANWVAGSGTGDTMMQQGANLFEQMGCATCHLMDGTGRSPSLRNVYGHPVQLTGGRTVQADEAYIRESIVSPNSQIVNGYQPNVMPSYQGQVSEEGLLQLVVYIKSLSAPPNPQPTPAPAPAPRRAPQQ